MNAKRFQWKPSMVLIYGAAHPNPKGSSVCGTEICGDITFEDGFLMMERRRCEWCNRLLTPGSRLRICEACRRAALLAFEKAALEPVEMVSRKGRKIGKARTRFRPSH